MTWTAYRIVLRLKSPLHVGQLTIGNLQRTRPYVPGKTLWGALTARLTRDDLNSNGDYQAMGERVNDELAFSYFYPALNDDGKEALYPDYTEKGLCYGPKGMSPDEFAWHLLSSYASTAVDARRTAAKEGSLHETEFISPYDNEAGDPVYLVGYVFEQVGSVLPWKEALNCLQLGGERKYGWGRISLSGEPQQADGLFGYSFDLAGERPVIMVEAGKPLLAHTVAEGVSARGQIEPLVGRETRTEEEFGEFFQPQVQICWAPGSVTTRETLVAIGPYGIWEVS
ncbi:MAG TPA: hypothetical protein ENI60_07080 [Candidatus Fraserbacteria bacterium]|nr:hypothetical protein [Candidatus Fraserbacteria bacterium]